MRNTGHAESINQTPARHRALRFLAGAALVIAILAQPVMTFLQSPVWVSLALVVGLLLDLNWAARPSLLSKHNAYTEAT